MIRFDVSPLVPARLGASLTLNVEAGPRCLFDLEVDYLQGAVRVTRVGGGLYLQGTVASQLTLECVRCLTPFSFPLTLGLEETFRLSGHKPHPDMPYAVSENGWLDLAPLLREEIWVALPMKPLCRSDCRGLCPHCGTNLNLGTCQCVDEQIDPRLALLKTLME